MILACRQLHKAYGIDVILEKITFHIEEREKAAIVGVNGAGKTTLFKVLTGEISADGGEFYLKKDASLGYLAQNIQIDSDRTIYEEMLSVFEKINCFFHFFQIFWIERNVPQRLGAQRNHPHKI